jgi:hypothetical protein
MSRHAVAKYDTSVCLQIEPVKHNLGIKRHVVYKRHAQP